jgi:transcriptional regulator with XRE-family HTH domain
MRTLQGVEAQVLARELGWSGAKLSRIEQGKIRVSLNDLASLLAALGAPEEARAELLATVAADDLGAWMVRSGGVVRRQREVGDLEERVSSFCEYTPLLVPGQLQSKDYTRALADAAGFDPDALVSARLRRQAALAIEDAPSYRALLEPAAFVRWPGDVAVMVGLLDHMLARLSLRNIEVRLLPDGGGVQTLALGAFVIYRFRESRPVVLLEHHGLDVFLATDADVKQYETVFEGLWAEARSEEQTRAWLTAMRRKLVRRRAHG